MYNEGRMINMWVKILFLFISFIHISAGILHSQELFLDWAGMLESNNSEVGYDLAIDANENMIITGTSRGGTDYDPGSGVYTIPNSGITITIPYVLKLNKAGSFVWAIQFAGPGSNDGLAIATDDSGYVYVGGSFTDSIDVDPDTTKQYLQSGGGSRDAYFVKLDSLGNLIWARSFGGPSEEICYSITVDKLGNVYATGYFIDSAIFNDSNGPISSMIRADSTVTSYTVKFDRNGGFIWSTAIQGKGYSRSHSIQVSDSGYVYNGGLYSGTTDFDPSSGSSVYTTNTNRTNLFVTKSDSTGKLLWVFEAGGNEDDRCEDISVTKRDEVLLTGYFKDTATFGSGVNQVVLEGRYDAYAAKLDQNGKLVFAKQFKAKRTAVGFGVGFGIHEVDSNIYLTGMFSDTVDFDPDSTVKLIGSYGKRDIFIVALNKDGNFKYAEGFGDSEDDIGTAIKASTPHIYCIGNFNNTIDFNPGYQTKNLTASNGKPNVFIQKLNECGSEVYLKQSHCYEFRLPDSTLVTQSSIYQVSLTNTAGCDSLVIYDLDIIKINPGISQSGNNLIANYTNASYQWLDCNDSMAIISNETKKIFNPDSSGSFSVVISDGICADTSDCFEYSTTGINGLSLKNNFNFYPNPTSESVWLNFDKPIEKLDITISNSIGQVVFRKSYSGIDILEIPILGKDGVYHLHINFDGSLKNIKIMKRGN